MHILREIVSQLPLLDDQRLTTKVQLSCKQERTKEEEKKHMLYPVEAHVIQMMM